LERKINTPINDALRLSLKAGEEVLITGTIYTGRDAAHKRLVEAIEQNEKLPFNLNQQVIFYVGPTPAKPHQIIGACGPTSSYRMDQYSPKLMENGLKVMIGKGPRSQAFRDELMKNQAVYLLAIGGLGAKLSQTVKENKTIAYDDLGTEAIRELKVVDFPAIVAIDASGKSIL
jgi:fumarate hydratase subunit beta